MSFSCINCSASLEASYKACPHCGEPVTDFLRQVLQAPLDGKYKIVSRLGRGGMGEVYKALHVHLNALRVIKVMRPILAADPEAHDRFMREARLATKIHNTNVATLHDFSTLPDGSWYMVWEFIDGTNLTELLRRLGALSPRHATTLSIQALMGLDAIHRAGIIHRDVSPDNIMIARDEHGDEQVKIIDLGIAKQGGETLDQQTRTGLFVGKWKYCSPEHLGLLPPGEKIDGRADIYSFGIVMYEMLTGAPPFISDTPQSYIAKHSKETPQPLRIINPSIASAPELESMIFRALEKDRAKRFQTARDFAHELDRILPSLPDDLIPDHSAQATLRLPNLTATQRVTDAPRGTTVRDTAPAVPTVRTQAPASRSRAVPLLVILALAVVVGIAAVAYILRPKQATPATVLPAAVATTPPATQVTPLPLPAATETTVTASAQPGPAATETASTESVAPPPQRPAPQPAKVSVTPVAPPKPQVVEPKPAVSTARPFPPDFVRPRKSFANTREFKEHERQLAILPNYEALGEGDNVNWKWVAPGVKLSKYKVRIARFRDMSKPAGDDAHRWLEQSMQEQVNGVTQDATAGTLTTENAIYWAEDDFEKKPRGVGVEMIFRDPDGNIVAMLRHLVRENTPADAAEEVAQAVADFVEDNE